MRGPDSEITDSNREITRQILKSLELLKPGTFVHANSIHSGENSAFGHSKAEMSQKIGERCHELGWNYVDVKLPNIFGERAKPFHNSFIATVIRSLHENRSYQIIDNPINLISAHEAAKYLLELCTNRNVKDLEPDRTTVSEVVEILKLFHTSYTRDSIPELETLFKLKLFNAYRYDLGPKFVKLTSREDPRGRLVELANFNGSSNTVFASETNLGFSRGNHYHFNKFERFIVLSGSGVIEIEELFSNEPVNFQVGGDNPCAVDIPTLSAHKLINVGSEKLFGIFIAIPKFDPDLTDTFQIDI
jgi:UDP-2-acetamido-2,6-beta-L-arabino-hexul-4-ose reductase